MAGPEYLVQRIGLERAAAIALTAYLEQTEPGTRPSIAKQAGARFVGVTEALHALGLGGLTPFAYQLDVIEVVRAARPQPPYEPTRNEERKAWRSAVVATIVDRWTGVPVGAEADDDEAEVTPSDFTCEACRRFFPANTDLATACTAAGAVRLECSSCHAAHGDDDEGAR